MSAWLPLLLLAAGAVAPHGESAPAFAQVDAWFEQFCAREHVTAAAVAVGRPGGGVVFSRGYGAARPDSLFRLASVSKPLTAAAVLRLVEQGRLGLADSVVSRLGLQPADPLWQRITIAQLLTHCAGFDRERSGDPMFRSLEIAKAQGVPAPAGPGAIVAWMARQPLDFAPGSRQVYSNFGYCLLGRVIERVTGQTYESFVRESVLGPLGLTSFQLGRSLPADRSAREVSYCGDEEPTTAAVVGRLGALVPWPDGGFCLEALDAHGGWVGSAPELVRFGLALDDPAHCPVLSADSLERLTQRPAGPAGEAADGRPKDVYYGYGWCVRPVGRSGRNAWHTGSLPGCASLLVRRWDGLVWAVLLNRRTGPGGADLLSLVDPALHRLVDAMAVWPV